MSGSYTKQVKEKKCKGCFKVFGARKKAGWWGGYQDYCPDCIKGKVFRKKYNHGDFLSDEGVVIYKNS